jgi:hypothetical protein
MTSHDSLPTSPHPTAILRLTGQSAAPMRDLLPLRGCGYHRRGRRGRFAPSVRIVLLDGGPASLRQMTDWSVSQRIESLCRSRRTGKPVEWRRPSVARCEAMTGMAAAAGSAAARGAGGSVAQGAASRRAASYVAGRRRPCAGNPRQMTDWSVSCPRAGVCRSRRTGKPVEWRRPSAARCESKARNGGGYGYYGRGRRSGSVPEGGLRGVRLLRQQSARRCSCCASAGCALGCSATASLFCGQIV